MELCDVAEECGFGEGAPDEGVHRLCDAFEREHLRDEQVHDVGLDAGALLQGSGHLEGEACARLGVAARAVLDLCVGVTHDLLEHDVDEGAPLVACAGGVDEVFATALARITVTFLTGTSGHDFFGMSNVRTWPYHARTLGSERPTEPSSHLPNVGDVRHRAIGVPSNLAPIPPGAEPARAALRSKGTSRMGAFRTLNRGTELLVDLT